MSPSRPGPRIVPRHRFELLLVALLDAWTHDAEVLRKRGSASQADLLLSLVADLREYVVERLDEELTLREAVEWSGFAYSTLEARVRNGTLPNAGRKGSPLIRRRDLPLVAIQRHEDAFAEDPNDLDQLLRGLGS